MSDADDPFGLRGDPGRTRIRTPRGTPDLPETAPQTPAWQAGTPLAFDVQTPAPAPQGQMRPRSPRPHPNALVTAHATLLELAPELERAAPPAQAQGLRVRLQGVLVDARDASVGMGVPLTRANQAAWFVAALLDDIALNTPWGGASDWPRSPLVTALSGDVDAGTRFFDHLDELLRHPNRDPELLELAYLCLGLGFRGKYRLERGAGEGQIIALRAQIARSLRNTEAAGAPLSPHWQGVDAPDERRRFTVPLWTVGLAAAAVLTALYMGLALHLGRQSEQLYALADRLPPTERAEIFRPVRTTVAPPAEAIPEPVVFELLPEFAAKAPPDTIVALKGREDAALAVLVVQATDPEVFRSARAEINEVYGPLIASVAAVIAENADVIGTVTVLGHTDNVPVQRTNPFASNQGLSEARAGTIAGLLAAGGFPADRTRAEGRADLEPVADNATREGRAQNRRIEIRIEKRL